MNVIFDGSLTRMDVGGYDCHFACILVDKANAYARAISIDLNTAAGNIHASAGGKPGVFLARGHVGNQVDDCARDCHLIY